MVTLESRRKTYLMEKLDWIFEYLMKNPFYFIFVFSVSMGLLSNEAYLKLKYPERNFYDGLLLKFIVSTFVCILVHAVYSWRKYDKEYEYLPLLLASFMYIHISKWINNSLFPILTKLFVNILTKKGDEEK